MGSLCGLELCPGDEADAPGLTCGAMLTSSALRDDADDVPPSPWGLLCEEREDSEADDSR